MRKENLIPMGALSSTSERTRATLRLTLEALGQEIAAEYVDALYLGMPSDIYRVINKLGGKTSPLMVVAHNPGLHALCLSLAGAGAKPEDRTRLAQDFSPATLAVFDVDETDWADFTPASPVRLLRLATPASLLQE